MTDRELMQMALDALGLDSYYGTRKYEAIEALRARLAQPEQRSGDCLLTGVCASEGHRIEKAQPEPEPAAWLDPDLQIAFSAEEMDGHNDPASSGYQPLYTAPPQREWQGLMDEEIWNTNSIMTFVTTLGIHFSDLREVARAIEARLKEKNNA